MSRCKYHGDLPYKVKGCPTCESEPPVRSSELVGRCVEVGDDDEGQPRLIIHTTREQLMSFGRNLAYSDVVVTIASLNAELTDAGPVTPASRETQSRHSVQ